LSVSEEPPDLSDLLKHYETLDEPEVAILMPIPEREQQMQLLKAYDLNSLI
jgi:hypothetical protein